MACAEGCAAAASAAAASGSRVYGTSALVALKGLCSGSRAISAAAWRDLDRGAHGMRMLCVLCARPWRARWAVRRAAHSARPGAGRAADGGVSPAQCWARQGGEQ